MNSFTRGILADASVVLYGFFWPCNVIQAGTFKLTTWQTTAQPYWGGNSQQLLTLKTPWLKSKQTVKPLWILFEPVCISWRQFSYDNKQKRKIRAVIWRKQGPVAT